ncbi:hypothetical protein SAMN04487897_101555 [Paenibacillus sp. yr247]|uniref:hypothetical protein n=1 Tax=Paenibacillus sp. yr247 TaxID=1761880 RepID=UPI0008852667|nr:hypothetical protein [Paenibacillus sp. yr247]SDM94079.1 hypothetical protein SAMN04487897_101555 [Paenibacillus sp. yr247]
MYSNNNSYGASSFGNASQGAQTSQGYQGANAQYQGINAQNQGYQKYQPVGLVQSFYNQPNAWQSGKGFNQAASTESFHTANYRGNQPSQQQQSNFQSGYSSYKGMNNQFGSNQSQPYGNSAAQQPSMSSQFSSSVQTNQPYGQSNVSPNSFHTANYRGNQPGHDAYKHSDSSSPSQQSFQSAYGAQQGIQQQGMQQQGMQHQGIQQQSIQSTYNQGFNNSGMGQQFGNNSSY